MENAEYAGFWRRLMAQIVDTVILWGGYWCVIFVITGSPFGKLSFPPFLSYIIDALYIILFLSSPWQATLGKRLMSIHIVTREDKKRLTFLRSLSRYLVLNAGFIYMLVVLSFSHIESGYEAISAEDQQHMNDISMKQFSKEQITQDDIAFQSRINHEVLAAQAHLSPEETRRYMDISERIDHKTPVTEEEQHFFDSVMTKTLGMAINIMIAIIPAFFYWIAVAWMVSISREKTGPHDIIAGTRAIIGRTPQKLF